MSRFKINLQQGPFFNMAPLSREIIYVKIKSLVTPAGLFKSDLH